MLIDAARCRLLDKLSHFRRIASRCDKSVDNLLAIVGLASIHLWLRNCKSMAELNAGLEGAPAPRNRAVRTVPKAAENETD
jgi:hypothetical protein